MSSSDDDDALALVQLANIKKQKILGAPSVVEKGKEVWHIRCDERIEHVSGPFPEFL
jgi:hypothetical protein